MQGTLAIFGGSFNPPHIAHQMACLYVLETQPIDHLICVPTFKHPFDKELLPFAHRLKMCELLVAPFGLRASVSRIEEELGGEFSRTHTMVEALRTRYPGVGLRLVIGADILLERDKWWRWADIAAMAPPVVVGRSGYPGDGGVELPAVSSSAVRAALAGGRDVSTLVPRTVLDYIREHALYQ
jgi:nicotinate-nucleotide adenylyltransferase